MKKILLITLFSIFAISTADGALLPRRQLHALHDEISDPETQKEQLHKLAIRLDQAIDGIVRLGLYRTYEEGEHEAEADQLKMEWEISYKGFLTRMTEKMTWSIDDQKPLIEFLDKFVTQMIEWLGLETCIFLEITDLRVFNNGLSPTFNPCTFVVTEGQTRKDEYREIFNEDPVYQTGVFSAGTKWVIRLTCSAIAGMGVGSLICLPVSKVAESWIKRTLGPKLSDRIQDGCV